MPELPEVETIRRDLEKTLAGDHAVSITVSDRRLMSRQEETQWSTHVVGQHWRQFRRLGKFLWVELANQWRVEFHLRMTGQLIIASGGTEAKSRMTITFDS